MDQWSSRQCLVSYPLPQLSKICHSSLWRWTHPTPSSPSPHHLPHISQLQRANHCGIHSCDAHNLLTPPFFVMAILAVPKIKVKRWLVVDMSHLDRQMYLNILFWIPNFWDSVSTLAGEVENPSQTFPKALLWAVVLVILSYVIPLARYRSIGA